VTALVTSVLIIDDDSGIRQIISEVLEKEQYLVQAVSKGKDALKACKAESFDVALIDIQLPDMKGTELIAQLRKLQPKIVTIMITGIPSLENAVKAVNERADAYMMKPLDMAELIKTIEKLLKEKTSEYVRMFAEASRAQQSTPIFKYQKPDNW
jgi:DNA-binding NtrC family response regulator